MSDLGVSRAIESWDHVPPDAFPEALVIADAITGRICRWNGAAEKLFGYTAAEVTNQTLDLLIPEHLRAAHGAGLARYLATAQGEQVDTSASLRVPARGKNGVELVVELTRRPVVGPGGGDGNFVLLVLRDITVRRRAEESLLADREALRSLAALAPIGIFRADAEGRCGYTNEYWQTLSGLTFEDSLGHGWTRAVHPLDRDRVLVETTQAARAGCGISIEFRLLTPTGHLRWVHARATAVLAPDGQTTGFVGTVLDITERRAAADARRAESDLLKAVLEHVETGIVACDAQGTLTLVNGAARGIHGQAMEPVPPDQWAEQYGLHRADGRTLLPTEEIPLFRALQGESVRDAEMMIIPKAGAPRSILASGQSLTDGTGTIIGAVVAMQDITERKKIERERRRADLAFSIVWEAASDAMVLSDENGLVLSANAAYCALYGYPAQQIIGQTFAIIFPEEQRAQMIEAYRAVFENPIETHGYESVIQRADGRERVVESRYSFIEQDGQRVAMLSVIRDVTERVLFERTLQAAERTARELAAARALYEAVVRNMVDGLAIIDHQDIVVFWNQAAEALYGVTAAEAVGRPVAEVTELFYSRTPDPAETRRQSEAARATANGGGPKVFEYHLDGAPPRDLAVLVFPIRDADGTLIGQGRLARDVTREREVERFKDELVSVVSHELRTPLASVVGFAELLLTREYPEAQRRQFLTTMHEEGRRLTGLINDFLDLQRLTSAGRQIARRPIDLLPLVRQVAASVGPDPERPIVLDLAAGPLPVVADSDRVRQVLINLLANARKYSPAGGEVCLTARRRDGFVEVEVADQGLGLPPEAFAHLFEKFYRVDNSDRRTIQGTGLGLAICREIIEAHGGRIWAESAGLGQGTRFVFTLPGADDLTSGFDVLVVEDDPAFASLLTAELTAGGLAAVKAGSAEEASQLLAAGRPQAVVLDLGLPGLSGPAFLPRLRELIGWDVPVIVVTAQEIDYAERRTLAKLGVLAFLAKGPGVAQEAAEILHQVVASRGRLPVGGDEEGE